MASLNFAIWECELLKGNLFLLYQNMSKMTVKVNSGFVRRRFHRTVQNDMGWNPDENFIDRNKTINIINKTTVLKLLLYLRYSTSGGGNTLLLRKK